MTHTEPLRGASLKAALRAIIDAPVRNLPTPEQTLGPLAAKASGQKAAARYIAKGKAIRKGKKHPLPPIKAWDVAGCVRDAKAGDSVTTLSERYGVHKTTIRTALRKHWPEYCSSLTKARFAADALTDAQIRKAILATDNICAAAKKLGIWRCQLARLLRDRPCLATGVDR